jgi:hypothetical protein
LVKGVRLPSINFEARFHLLAVRVGKIFAVIFSQPPRNEPARYVGRAIVPKEEMMQFTTADWVAIAAYFAVNLAIGLFFMKRASGNVGEFFLSGRNVSWLLAGTSMVATTFGADTPLIVTGLIYNQ